MTASRFSSNMCPHGEGQNVRGEPRIRDRALRSRNGSVEVKIKVGSAVSGMICLDREMS
jgi:hypothetical protein